eukprot:TRINITY_DN46536_c0_g1_i1.p1 TRINITY_DN46536_c0_g1~~TRINITY_DN46536_c0_g1_i1.p1  ORF type:complete len:293 (-),score=67.05 TRINITY_DN46536_c0_g1_i1:74-841(-)
MQGILDVELSKRRSVEQNLRKTIHNLHRSETSTGTNQAADERVIDHMGTVINETETFLTDQHEQLEALMQETGELKSRLLDALAHLEAGEPGRGRRRGDGEGIFDWAADAAARGATVCRARDESELANDQVRPCGAETVAATDEEDTAIADATEAAMTFSLDIDHQREQVAQKLQQCHAFRLCLTELAGKNSVQSGRQSGIHEESDFDGSFGVEVELSDSINLRGGWGPPPTIIEESPRGLLSPLRSGEPSPVRT